MSAVETKHGAVKHMRWCIVCQRWVDDDVWIADDNATHDLDRTGHAHPHKPSVVVG